MYIASISKQYARFSPLAFSEAVITGGFWAERQKMNREVSLHHGYQMLEEGGNFANFRIVAGLQQGEHRGFVFNDSDVYKWLEAVAYELLRQPNPELEALADEAIAWVAAAQEPDGYLNTSFHLHHKEHFTDLDHDHEIYCAGHLFQAGVAYARATGKETLLQVARSFADLLDAVFGPNKKQGTCGHPNVELGLVELYRYTREERYLKLCQFFIDQRGKGVMRAYGQWGWGPEYHQDRTPLREAVRVEGHAVRQLYLTAGATDLYLETGEPALFETLQRLWADMTAHQAYLTGGFGARSNGEAFGDPYELPSRSYCETCASIGAMMWAWRMLLVTGDCTYADWLERTLYNSFLSSTALDGKHFFYVNPLESLGGVERKEWYRCCCCPPNIMRQVASLGHYLATTQPQGIQIHQYATATIASALEGVKGRVRLDVKTAYPWEGHVRIEVREAGVGEWALALRVPGWCPEAQLSLNGQLVQEPHGGGYATLKRAWRAGDYLDLDLPLEPMWIKPHPWIDALRGCLALQRGPLVYCFEAADFEPGLDLRSLQVRPGSSLQALWKPDLLGGVEVIDAGGQVFDLSAWQGHLYLPADQAQTPVRPLRLRAIPYFAWANRGPGAMRVWIAE